MRRIASLAVVALAGGAVALLAPATPASAHTAAFQRDCTSVTLNLQNFKSSKDKPNVVSVTRDGTVIDTISFLTSSVTKKYSQPADGLHAYEAKWSKTGPDGESGDEKSSLPAPKNCVPPTTPPATVPPTTPPAGQPTGTVTRDCDGITVHVTGLPIPNGTSLQLQVKREETVIGTLTVDNSTFTGTIKEDASAEHTYTLSVITKGHAQLVTTVKLPAKTDCVPASHSASPSPSVPATTLPAPSKAASALPVTGGPALPLGAGAVALVASGALAVFVARRRHSMNAA